MERELITDSELASFSPLGRICRINDLMRFNIGGTWVLETLGYKSLL